MRYFMGKLLPTLIICMITVAAFAAAGPYSSQVQLALRNFLATANIYTAAQTFGVSGTAIKQITITTCSVDPGSIIAVIRGSATCTITGAAVGDGVTCQPPSTLNTGLSYSGCEVTGANTVTIYMANVTALAVDDSARTWRIVWFDVT